MLADFEVGEANMYEAVSNFDQVQPVHVSRARTGICIHPAAVKEKGARMTGALKLLSGIVVANETARVRADTIEGVDLF